MWPFKSKLKVRAAPVPPFYDLVELRPSPMGTGTALPVRPSPDRVARHRTRCLELARTMLAAEHIPYDTLRQHLEWSGHAHKDIRTAYQTAIKYVKATDDSVMKQELWHWFETFQ